MIVLQLCRWQFSVKLRSRLYSIEVELYSKNGFVSLSKIINLAVIWLSYIEKS